MGFVGRWLTDAISLGLSLFCALAAMQIPALTRDYTAALLQVAEDVRRDVDQREDSARRFYHMTASTDEAVISALQPFEPSNAQTLAGSLDRSRNLQRAHDRIESAPAILQPLVAGADIAEDTKGYKGVVLATSVASFTPQLVISAAAAVYGLVGLAIGSLIAQLVLSLLMRLVRAPDRRSPVQG